LEKLLATKFHIPAVRPELVQRPRLFQKLSAGLDHKVTLISAPAGFGKTTLLSGYLSHLAQPAAWLSLDEADNDPAQFWSYLITACQTFMEDIGKSALELFDTQPSLTDDVVPTILINDLSEFDHSAILVLDDYHAILTPAIHNGMQFLLEHLPHQMHIILSTRADPPWPLGRFRASNQLVEIRAQDLRFTIKEAEEFLNRMMGLNLTPEEVNALEGRIEGWVAGLQLAALSMQGRSDNPAFVKAFSGSNLYVAEYLVEEVLQRQTEDMRTFLLKTSILKRMTASLCEAVADCEDGQARLHSLQHTNTFLVPLDNEGQWFRYHHLFAELLQSHLKHTFLNEEIASLHLCAARWFENHHFSIDAVQHAFAAKNYEKAAALVDQYGQEMFYSEKHHILTNWLDALPTQFIQSNPRLQIYRLLIDLLTGTLDMYEQTLIEKEKLIKSLPKSPENDDLRRSALVNLALFFAFQNTNKAFQIAEEALAEIPETDLKLRAYIYSVFYRTYGTLGNIEKSAAAYRESFRLAELTGQYEMISNTTKIRTFDLCQYGRLDEAMEYCQRIIDIGARRKSKVFYPGPCYVGLAGVYLERNDLQKAEENLRIGLEMCHQGAMYGLFTGYVQKVRLLQAKGEIEEALKQLQWLEQNFQRREFTFMAQKVSLLLAAQELTTAASMVPYLQEILGASQYAQNLPLVAAEVFKLCLVRIYIAINEIEKAFQLLDDIQSTVEPDGRLGRLMEVYLLRALAFHKTEPEGVSQSAREQLERALKLAIGPGFMMLFLEEGQNLIPILTAVVNHKAAMEGVRQYAGKLLGAFAQKGQAAELQITATNEQLVEPLTPRELEVLQLIAAGDSNQEIADKLVVSLRTIKKHTSNIYGKLDVGSRIQAVARSRQIGLLTAD
jgi:LuxR family maltose regulon positive regulatory protein